MSFVGVKVHRSLRQSKQEKKSLNCPWLPPLFRLWPLVNYLVYFTTPSLRNHYEWERVLDHVWEDGLCKIHSIKCSKLCFCLACSKLCFCLAPAKRKVVPPQLRGPSPPIPLRNFGSVTFHPNSFTCCTFVWSRRLRSITPLYITVPVDPSPPVYRHYSPKCQRRKKVITKMNTTKRGLHIVGKWAPVANASVLFSFKFLVYFPCA